eukprot:m.58603 g.58603  ORF g.58603 m.58603 type:complete len:53 (+) comp22576_c0_seq1:3-161(+)
MSASPPTLNTKITSGIASDIGPKTRLFAFDRAFEVDNSEFISFRSSAQKVLR